VIPGRILYAGPGCLWLGKGHRLFRSRDGGSNWQEYARVAASPFNRAKSAVRLSRRLTRAGIHHFLPGERDVLFYNSDIFVRGTGEDEFRRTAGVKGSRPLAVARHGVFLCYGEYLNNADRRAVRIWASEDSGLTWNCAWTFAGVRHVHGVFFDEFTGNFWVTTGDDDEESAIWVTEDRFGSLHRVVGGSQATRAVQLLFTADSVYFGSDSPLERNYLYRLERGRLGTERLQAVGSSVFFGCKVGHRLFFSTAVEPSTTNFSRHAELWCSTDGDRWRILRSFRKDAWSLKYFQYGQVLFPAGPGDDRFLYFTPFATQGDQRTDRIALADLDADPAATESVPW